MNLNILAKEINENAVAHGWWEGERSDAEIRALIHSEWSEALEEYRAGRPLVWHGCGECGEYDQDTGEPRVCNPQNEHQCTQFPRMEQCSDRIKKPEGIAVELADGCIRILDFFAHVGVTLPDEIASIDGFMEYCEKHIERIIDRLEDYPLPELVDDLHFFTAESVNAAYGSNSLVEAVGIAFLWIKAHGLDPAQIMQEKHEYNKLRSYKHGGKVC